MKQTIKLLEAGFESSSGLTPEFKKFYSVFKSEFSKELKKVGATNIVFNRGHFHVSGFCTINSQPWYFSLPDVRSFYYGKATNPDSCMNKLLYRTAKDYKDSTGGYNRYARIETGMSKEMFWSFRTI